MDDLLFNPFSDLSEVSSTPTADATPQDAASHPSEPQPTSTDSAPAPQALSPAEVAKLHTSLLALRTQIDNILDILKANKPSIPHPSSSLVLPEIIDSGDQRTLEGIFDGEKMIGDDGGIYTIPPNYASKSKLVEGDRLKLTISPNGSFIYKQVKPINRKRLVGEMVFDQDLHQWGVFSEGKLYKVLKASVTFYKGNIGDEAVILVAEDVPCTWGAIENIIHK